jgi:hypothetical protein
MLRPEVRKEDWAVKAMDGPEGGKMDRLRRAGIFRLARMAEEEHWKSLSDLGVVEDEELKEVTNGPLG